MIDWEKIKEVGRMIRAMGRMSVEEIADSLGLTTIGYVKKNYVPRILKLPTYYSDEFGDVRFVFTGKEVKLVKEEETLEKVAGYGEGSELRVSLVEDDGG